jgi:hypothetical protein
LALAVSPPDALHLALEHLAGIEIAGGFHGLTASESGCLQAQAIQPGKPRMKTRKRIKPTPITKNAAKVG